MLTDRTGAPVTVTSADSAFNVAVAGKTLGRMTFVQRDGRRIVALCPMLAAYVKEHHRYDDVVDHPTREILQSLQ